jgi:hypothetical protein
MKNRFETEINNKLKDTALNTKIAQAVYKKRGQQKARKSALILVIFLFTVTLSHINNPFTSNIAINKEYSENNYDTSLAINIDTLMDDSFTVYVSDPFSTNDLVTLYY